MAKASKNKTKPKTKPKAAVKAGPRKKGVTKPKAKPKARAKVAAKKAAPKKKMVAKTPTPKIVPMKPQGKNQVQQKPTPLTATGSNVLWKLLADRKAQNEAHKNEGFAKLVDKANEKERFANHQARFARFAGPRRRAS